MFHVDIDKIATTQDQFSANAEYSKCPHADIQIS